MIQIVKFIALSLGLAFSGTPSETNITSHTDHHNHDHEVKVEKDTTKEASHRVKELNTHTCGYDHAIALMKKHDPDYEAKMKFYDEVVLPAIQKEAKKNRKSGLLKKAEVISIPIVFHIIHKPGQSPGSGENLSDQDIIDQLETLNEDFSALNPGWSNIPPRWADIKGNPEIKFCLAEVDPQGAASTGITRHEYTQVTDANIRSVIKPETGWPTLDYYNVWTLPIPGTTAQGGVAGYAYLPYPGTPGANFDGTVLDYRFTGKGSRTLSHEIGHGFGLKHTWGNGGCGDDDGISDTPLQSANTNSISYIPCNGSTWPMGPSTCSSLEHMYINYMDYVPSACRTTFTQGQVDVMRACALGSATPGNGLNWASRNQLVQNAPTVAPVCNVGTPTGGGDPGGGGPGPVVTLDYDAGIQNILNPTGGEFCGAQLITPRVILTNDVGDTPLTSCVIRYKITGIPGSTAFNWSGNLAKEENEVVDLAPFNSPEFNFELTIWTDSPNGEQDENGFNDERVISLVTPEVLDPNIFEDFEDETSLPTSTEIESINPGNNFRKWDISDYSAYNVGGTSAVFRNFQDPNGDGKVDILEFPVLDFEEIENPRIAFDVAYYNINNYPENDTLEIRVSTDCGETFTTVFYQGGEDLATVSQFQPSEFFPEANQWRNEVVELFSFAGAERMLIEIVNIGYGNNNVYIDNINLSDGCASNVQVSAGDLTCPGECDGFVNLILNGFIQEPEITWSANVEGQTGESLDELCPGTYSVTVYDAEFDCEFIQEIEISSPEEIKLIVNGTDITIPGADNGSVSAQAFGGTDYFDYKWNTIPVETEPFVTGLQAGVYCVTATDQAGCEITDCIELFGFECELEVDIQITQPTCDGQPGIGIVTITNATTPFIVWSQGGPPQTGGFLLGPNENMNLSAGPLYINISDQAIPDCEETYFFQIYSSSPPNLNEVIENESTLGSNDGSIDLNVDGDSEYTYAWSTGTSTTEELTGIGAGSYTVTITDINNDCEHIESYSIENLNCTLMATATITNATCFNDQDGEIVINASSGSGPYDYMWPSGPNFSAQFNLAAGIYPVTVVDDSGCKVIVEAIVEQPALLDIVLQASDESSPGALDGTVTANVSGGTAPYEYAWSNSITGTNTITGLSGDIYLVTVTDVNGCETVKGAAVEGLDCPTIVLIQNQNNVSCFGEANGEVSVAAEGGVGPYTYLWTPGDYEDAVVPNLPAGEYSVLVKDADGCPATTVVNLTQPSEFTVTLSAMDESSSGAMDGSITTSVVGGVGELSYLWSGTTSFNSNSANLSQLSPDEYCLTITDETSCSAQACITINGGSDPCAAVNIIVEFDNVEPESVLGANDGSLSVVVSGATGSATYLWTDQNQNTYTGNPIMNLAPGTYTVVVTDENGCMGEGTAAVIQGVNPCDDFDVEDMIFAPIVCKGDATGTATVFVETGQEPYTYLWSNDNDTETATGLPAGLVTVTVTDANNCIATGTITVTEPELALDLSVTSLNESVAGANNGSATANITGGSEPYNYMWTGPGGFSSSLSIINNLVPGTYCVVATDGMDCMKESCVDVQAANDPCVNVEIEVSLFSDIFSCSNQVVTVFYEAFGGTGPYEVVWSIANEPTQTTQTVDISQAGSVSIIVTDANGCLGEATYEVQQDFEEPGFEVNTTNPSSATSIDGGAMVIIGSSSDYTYEWFDSSGQVIGQGISIGDLPVGQYSVEVTDSQNGCFSISNFELTAEPADCATFELSITIENITCIGSEDGIAQLDLSNGTGPYDYTWIPELENSPVQDGLSPGTYQVTATDANGCSDNLSFEIEDAIALELEFQVSQVSSLGAMDGSITATVSGGTPDYFFAWNTGSNFPTIDGLEEGEYCVTVVDENGCPIEDCVTVEIATADCSEFEAELVFTNQISCFQEDDGAIQVNILNATEPITYEWSNNLPATQQQTSLMPGEYAVTVTDANDCFYESSITLIEPEFELIVELTSTPVTIIGAANGTATVVATGGDTESPYVYIWSDAEAQTTPTAINLDAGEYCVTVGSGSCSTVECIEVFDANDPCLNFDVEHEVFGISCSGECDGIVNLNVVGGEEPYSFNWSTNDVGQDLTNGCAGIGSVTITDANDCIRIIEFLIEEVEELDVAISSTNASSNTANDGSVNAAAFGGTAPYNFEWNIPADGPSLINLAPDTYTVLVTDANGCTVMSSVEVGVGEDDCGDLVGEVFVQDVSCFGASDGTVFVEIDGGSGFYTYNWSVGTSLGSTQGDLPAVEFVLIVTDENDCEIAFDVVVNEPEELVVNVLDVNNTSGPNLSDGSLSIEIVGGTPPYDIDWNEDFDEETEIDEIPAGEYTISVEDANGCATQETITISDGGTGEGDCEDLSASFLINPVSCFTDADGSIEVFPTGGTEPYEISSSANMLSGLPASNYTITVEDAEGCIFEELVVVPTPNSLDLIPQGFDGICGVQGIAEVVVSGGTPPFSIEWSNNQTGPIITGLETGEYLVTVTDDNGCSETDMVSVVTEFTPIEFELNSTNTSCDTSSDGTITIKILNGVSSSLLTFMWNDGIVTKDRSGLPGGVYQLTIIDPVGCEYIVSAEILSPSSIVPSYSIEQGSTNSLFNVTVNVVGGTSPYTYAWSDGSTNFYNEGLGIGSYTVVVTDSEGCEKDIEVVVNGSVSVLDNLDIIADFSLTPNPTTGEFYVDVTMSRSTIVHMTVYNILGQHISHNVFSGSNINERLSLSDQPSGTYYIRLHNEQGQLTKKIIKVD